MYPVIRTADCQPRSSHRYCPHSTRCRASSLRSGGMSPSVSLTPRMGTPLPCLSCRSPGAMCSRSRSSPSDPVRQLRSRSPSCLSSIPSVNHILSHQPYPVSHTSTPSRWPQQGICPSSEHSSGLSQAGSRQVP